MGVLLRTALALFALNAVTVAHPEPLTVVHQWSQLEFDYPSEEARQEAIDIGEFIEGAAIPIDVDVIRGRNGRPKVFITTPQVTDGIPIAVGTVTDRTLNGNPVIAPFPSWAWYQNRTDCPKNRILSVFRIKVDECGRLWVLDTGRTPTAFACSPQILAFDPNTGAVLHRYEIPDDQLESSTQLVTPIVDVRSPPPACRDTFVYAADPQGIGLIVHDVDRAASWRVTDDSMNWDTAFQTFTIAGESFDLLDGILGMDISPNRPGEDRRLYFHPMTSGTESWVSTAELRANTTATFHTYSGQRNSQEVAEAIDRNGISFFGLTTNTSLNCWNTATEYGEDNIDTLIENEETLQFMSGIKVISDRPGEQQLWFMTNRFQKLMTGTLSTSEINFRIQTGNVENVLRDSSCVIR